jgi:hypothetical protein
MAHFTRRGVAADARPAAAEAADTAAAASAAALDPHLAAWLAAVPALALAVLAAIVFGPALGRLLLASPHAEFWLSIAATSVDPEPTEQARYLILLAAPMLLAALTLALVRRAPARVTRTAPAAAGFVELAAVAFVVACFVVQATTIAQDSEHPVPYFTVPSIIVAAGIAVAILAVARTPRLSARWALLARESSSRRVAAALLALAAIAMTLLPAINTDGSLLRAHSQVSFHVQFIYDEAMAVLDHHSPLYDFATQYASLLPYLLAGSMALFGTSAALFTGLLALLEAAAMLSVFAILRRVTRSSLAALLLFVPVLATSAWHLRGEAVARFSLVNYFGVLPLRYAGPLVLAWLLARHLDGDRPRNRWLLFLAGGIVAVNNLDFGVPALGATAIGLLWADARAPARLAREAAIGVAAALALVVAFMLVRTGALPHFSLLTRYADVFARKGFGMFPIKPLIGLSTVIFLTYVGAIGCATVRAIRGDAERALTGLLAWSGVFGLGAGCYYVGRSRAEQLDYMFPAWAFALALLTVVAARWLARTEQRPAPAGVAVLVGFGLLVCSLAQTAAPWSQLRRIAADGPPILQQPHGERFVAEHTSRGEPVAIVADLGHRIAVRLGLDDVEPYSGNRSIFTREQLRESLAALRAAGGQKVFVGLEDAVEVFDSGLRDAYDLRDMAPEGMQLWVAREAP